MTKQILQLLKEQDETFMEESLVERLFLMFEEMFCSGKEQLSDQVQEQIKGNCNIATNLYEISAELIRWYATKISDDPEEKIVIETAKWLRLSNLRFFRTYCEKRSIGVEFLKHYKNLDSTMQREFMLYFYHILHFCPPYEFTESVVCENVGTNWYCGENK